jgi:phage baseplate assembly protein W
MDQVLHLAFPFRLVNGAYATHQQDTDPEAADCVRNILSFEKGDRIEDLDFGIEDPTFQTMPIDIDDIAQAIADYEPRVVAEITTDDQADGTEQVSIFVTLPTSDESTLEA